MTDLYTHETRAERAEAKTVLDAVDIINMQPPGWTMNFFSEDGELSDDGEVVRLYLHLHLSEKQESFIRTAVANRWSIAANELGFITLTSPQP